MTYFPAKLWNRRKELNEIMKEKRKTNPDLRYQIMVGKKDIALKIKQVGEYLWQYLPIEEYLPSTKYSIASDNGIHSPIFKRNNKRNLTPEKEVEYLKKSRNMNSPSL